MVTVVDADNRDRFIELLNEQRQAFDASLLFVSHDAALAAHFDRVVELSELNAVRAAAEERA
jgi:putative ABC transport system ATP-binding protein